MHPDHPGAGGDRVRVDVHEPGAGARRAHDPRMDHARRADILDIGCAARDLGGDVDPRQRLADEGVSRRIAKGDPLGHRCVEFDLRGDLGEREAPPVRRGHRAAVDSQAVRRQAETAPGGVEEQGPRGRGGVPDRGG